VLTLFMDGEHEFAGFPYSKISSSLN